MQYSFTAQGHPDVRATHRRTLEFTADTSLTSEGDCILGVKADFSLEKLKPFLAVPHIEITIAAGGVEEHILAVPNPQFADENEMVIRMSDFGSERTFAIRADKAAAQVDRKLVAALRDGATATIEITTR